MLPGRQSNCCMVQIMINVIGRRDMLMTLRSLMIPHHHLLLTTPLKMMLLTTGRVTWLTKISNIVESGWERIHVFRSVSQLTACAAFDTVLLSITINKISVFLNWRRHRFDTCMYSKSSLSLLYKKTFSSNSHLRARFCTVCTVYGAW